MEAMSRDTEERLTELFVLASALHFGANGEYDVRRDIDPAGQAAYAIIALLDRGTGRTPGQAAAIGLRDLVAGLHDLCEAEDDGLSERDRAILAAAARDLAT